MRKIIIIGLLIVFDFTMLSITTSLIRYPNDIAVAVGVFLVLAAILINYLTIKKIK